MARLLTSFICLLLAIPCSLSATENSDNSNDATEFENIAQFIDGNIIGKTLETKIKTPIVGGDLETEFQRRSTFINFRRYDDIIQFDELIAIKQKLWDLDENGKRLSDIPKIKNRVLLSRCKVKKLKSTGEAIGFRTTISTSAEPYAGASSIRMGMKDGELVIISDTALYSEGFAKGGGYQQMATSETRTFTSREGKLSATTEERVFKVNPETLERSKMVHDVLLNESEIKGLY